MKKSSAEAKFFCESCGSEVPSKAKVCPVCGKFFASVRCPKCGCTGASEDFIKGCPNCGYAMRPEDIYGEDYVAATKSKSSKEKKHKGLFSSGSRSSNSGSDSSLPFWIYIIPLSILAVLIAILYSCF